MARRYEDWLNQSERDITAAKHSLESEDYEWAAFQAQQGAEKALKALLRFHNLEVKGHTILALLSECEKLMEIAEVLKQKGRSLDRHYIAPRYPNGFASGYPGEYYDEPTAKQAISDAEEILKFVNKQIS